MSENAYSLPEIYDIAFAFRDFSKAVDFLCQVSANAGMTDITSMIELCCGPGQYCREFSRRGIEAYGIDQSNEMVQYAQKLIAEEKLSCKIIEDDVRTFMLPQKVDLAVCMMASRLTLPTSSRPASNFSRSS